jgi:hypothetical protein
MNTRAFLLSSLIAGVAMGLLGGLPIISVLNCILCLWVWGSAMVGIFLYFKFDATKARLSLGQGALIGLLSGAIGAIIVWLLSLLTRGMAMKMIAQLLASTGTELPGSFFSPTVSFFSLFTDLVLYAIFGVIGGLIGASVFKGKGLAPVTASAPVAPPQIVESTPVMPEPAPAEETETAPEPLETSPEPEPPAEDAK